MSIRDEARSFAARAIDTAIGSAVGAIERAVLRRRAESCERAVEARYMIDHLPRWRRIARAIWRARHRRAEAQCQALKSHRDVGDVACEMCEWSRLADEG